MVVRSISVGAIASLALAASASADVVTRFQPITNDTGVNWEAVVFYLLPNTPLFDRNRFAAIRIVESPGLQGSSLIGATVTFPDAPRNDEVRFTFDESSQFLGNGQTVTFSITVDDPTNYGFRLGWRVFEAPPPPVPAPAGAAALLAAIGLGASRRRR